MCCITSLLELSCALENITVVLNLEQLFPQANPAANPTECSSDLYSELTQSLHSVSYDSDQLDGTQSSLHSPLQLLTVKTDPVTSPSPVTEVPAIMEVWGVDSLMDQFFKSIYPNMSTETSVLQ